MSAPLRSAGLTSARAGRYTALLKPEGEFAPPGFGYGQLVVNTSGAFRLTGALPDGAAFSQGGALAIDDTFALYVPLYGGARAISGGVEFGPPEESAKSELRGTLLWSKPRRPRAARFRAPFDVPVLLLGARYTAPLAGQNSLTLTAASAPLRLAAAARNWPAVLDLGVSLDPDHRGLAPAEPRFALRVDAATGFFRGELPDAETGRPRRHRGVLLQGAAQLGAGFFLTETASGAVQFTLEQ